MTYLLFTDPLAANLFLIGMMFIGIAAYIFYRFFLGKENTEVDNGFAYFLLGTGLYSVIYGLMYSILWPAPEGGGYSILFGDPLALFGFVSVFAGFSIIKKANLGFVGIFGFFAGLYAIISGYEGYLLSMTRSPISMFLMYLGTGFGGIFVLPLTLLKPKSMITKIVAILALIAFVGAAIISFYTGASAIGGHMKSFAHAYG
jgi:putative membrane protein